MSDNNLIKESETTYLYLFPELTDEDVDMLKAYGLTFEGKNRGPSGNEDNWVVTGNRTSLERYADKWLGYELHPDYLYEYDDFAGDIVNESYNVEQATEQVEVDDDTIDGIVVSDKKVCESFEGVTQDEVIDWLSEHDTSYEDAEMFFNTKNLQEVDKEDVISWISDHNQLYDDFKRFFKDKLILDEAVGRPSQATLDDCLDYYKNNAFGYNGVEDYVDTEFPMHSQEFKAEVCDYIKTNKNESLEENLIESIDTVCDYCKQKVTLGSDMVCPSCNEPLIDSAINTIVDENSDLVLIFTKDGNINKANKTTLADGHKPIGDSAIVVPVTKDFFDSLKPTVHDRTDNDSDLGGVVIDSLPKEVQKVLNTIKSQRS